MVEDRDAFKHPKTKNYLVQNVKSIEVKQLAWDPKDSHGRSGIQRGVHSASGPELLTSWPSASEQRALSEVSLPAHNPSSSSGPSDCGVLPLAAFLLVEIPPAKQQRERWECQAEGHVKAVHPVPHNS